jgi:hypothetical protein
VPRSSLPRACVPCLATPWSLLCRRDRSAESNFGPLMCYFWDMDRCVFIQRTGERERGERRNNKSEIRARGGRGTCYNNPRHSQDEVIHQLGHSLFISHRSPLLSSLYSTRLDSTYHKLRTTIYRPLRDLDLFQTTPLHISYKQKAKTTLSRCSCLPLPPSPPSPPS